MFATAALVTGGMLVAPRVEAAPRSTWSSSISAAGERLPLLGSSATTRAHAASSGPADGVQPVGFDLTTATLRSADRTVELTLWLAATPEQWNRGLMGVTDLGVAEGMIFVFERPAIYRFYMWQTPLPLDIVFVDESGAVVGWAEMEPCLDASADRCARYAPSVPYLSAVEVPRGALDGLDLDGRVSLTVSRQASPAGCSR